MPTGKNVPAGGLTMGSGKNVADDNCCMQLVSVCVHGAGGMVYCMAQAPEGQDRNYSGRRVD